MRTYILLVFVGVLQLAAADYFSRFKREIAARSGSLIRQKRSTIFDEVSEHSCEEECDQVLQSNVNMTGFEGTENPFSFLTYNASSLEAVCKQYEASKGCYTKCTKASTTISGVYHITCEERKAEILKHIPCYEAAESVSESYCEAKCGSIDTIMNATEMTMNSLQEGDISSFGKMFDAIRPLCKFLQCAIECGMEIFTKQCPNDPEAGTFFKEMSALSAATTLHDLDELDASLGLHLMPNECRALSGHTTVQSNEDVDDMQGGQEEEVNTDAWFPDDSHETDAHTSHMQQMLMEKQAIIFDKASRNLDAELEKLNLEKLLLEKQLKP